MGNIPLHPLVVHLPLVLAALLPFVVLAILWGDRRGRLTARSWWIGVGVAALLTAGAFVSVKTGEREEEVVESVVPEAALERHEERAEAFLWATLAPLALLGLTVAVRTDAPRRWIGTGALVASLALAGLAVGVGHSGGSLVYEHGAASAYTDPGTAATAAREGVERD